MKEIKEYQNLIQKQNEKYKNIILQDQSQAKNVNPSKSLKDIYIPPEQTNNKSMESLNYSALFDPEILKILSKNFKNSSQIKEDDKLFNQENIFETNKLNSSMYSFADRLSNAPSREFRCSRHFLNIDGKGEDLNNEAKNKNQKIKANAKKINRTRKYSYEFFNRKTKKLEKIIRKLSLGSHLKSLETFISAIEMKKDFIKKQKELTQKLQNKKFVPRKSMRNFDHLLQELKEGEILKIINSIEGIIEDGTNKKQ